MKSLVIVFGALLLMIATPSVFTAIDKAVTLEYTQSFAGVTTGGGDYDYDVTLTLSLYNEALTSVSGVSSNISEDIPTAANWTEASRVLTVGGLAQSQDRTLSVEYMIDNASLDSGMITFLTVCRWFWVLLIFGFVGGAVYAFFD
ncbi:MAG: hypothetical protein A2Z70_01305 [Chloroflexi bacterium RBG_13_48_17]|nr:MAG: hypothetical protein A2Z70_01305 [Chloroflexi bacterium RBG_13_48_17]